MASHGGPPLCPLPVPGAREGHSGSSAEGGGDWVTSRALAVGHGALPPVSPASVPHLASPAAASRKAGPSASLPQWQSPSSAWLTVSQRGRTAPGARRGAGWDGDGESVGRAGAGRARHPGCRPHVRRRMRLRGPKPVPGPRAPGGAGLCCSMVPIKPAWRQPRAAGVCVCRETPADSRFRITLLRLPGQLRAGKSSVCA